MKTDLTELIAEAKRLQAVSKRPRYPIDFKRKVVVASQDYGLGLVISELGIGRSTLEKWRRVYAAKPKTQNPDPSTINFVPVIPTATEPKSASEAEVQLEFSDERGRRLSLRMPWRAELADSLLQFVTQMTGGLSCYK